MKKYIFLISVFVVLLAASCKKAVEGTEIYPKADPPLVEFLPDRPLPNIASAGDVVKIAIEGLKGKEFKAYMSSVPAEVVEVTDKSISIKMPADAITGTVSVLINGQMYFGPVMQIRGSVAIDPNFDVNSYRATQGSINGIIQRDASTYLLYGGFQSYQDKQDVLRGVAIINSNGAYASTLTGANADLFSLYIPKLTNINHIVKLAAGGYLVAGGFSTYADKPVNGIVRVDNAGRLDTMKVEVINPDPANHPENSTEIVSALNGGVGGSIQRAFVTTDNKYIAAGNFQYHVSTYYPMSQKGAPYVDRVEIPSITKMFNTGLVDSSYNYDFAFRKGGGANAFVTDAVKLPNDDVILVGNFTGFQNQPAGGIVKINAANGKVSSSFNAGTGVDGFIRRITFNPAIPNRYVLSGAFKKYNGVEVNGVAVIDGNGTLISTFKAKEFSGGLVNYAAMLANGNVIVSGSFTNYGTKVRPGLAILNSAGELIDKYNKFGLFRGMVNDMIETTSNGMPSIFLVGSFDRYDNIPVGSIVKLNFTN